MFQIEAERLKEKKHNWIPLRNWFHNETKIFFILFMKG